MAYVQIVAPKYYSTLMSYGYTLDEVKALSSKNTVPVEEVNTAYKLKDSGKSDTEIIAYFKSQGYSDTQLREFQKYLDTANTKDATGSTKRQRIENTIKDINSIAPTALGLLGLFFGKSTTTNTIPTLPDISSLTASTGTTANLVYDDGTGKIKSDPGLTGFGLGDIFTVSNVAIFFLIVFIVYLVATSSKSQPQSVQKRR